MGIDEKKMFFVFFVSTTVVATLACFAVLILVAIVLIHRTSRNLVDRVSFRIMTYAMYGAMLHRYFPIQAPKITMRFTQVAGNVHMVTFRIPIPLHRAEPAVNLEYFPLNSNSDLDHYKTCPGAWRERTTDGKILRRRQPAPNDSTMHALMFMIDCSCQAGIQSYMLVGTAAAISVSVSSG
ncbi:hypothetical protein MPER_12288, partial [Moniliophthora perniciosa FA553]